MSKDELTLMYARKFVARYIQNFSKSEPVSVDDNTLYEMYKMTYISSMKPFGLNKRYFQQKRGEKHVGVLLQQRLLALGLSDSELRRFINIYGLSER